MITEEKQSARLIYEDGTEVVMSENSAVTLEPRDQDGVISTKLEQGVVKTQVIPKKSKLQQKNFRFLVKTKGVVLGVRGTEFWVQYDSKADEVKVNTLEGKVEAAKTSNDLQRGVTVALNPNFELRTQKGNFDSPKPFDPTGFSKNMQSQHREMHQMIVQSQNRPVSDLPGFQGSQIRNEHIEREKNLPSESRQGGEL